MSVKESAEKGGLLHEKDISCHHGSRIGSRFGGGIKQLAPVGRAVRSLWTIRSMMPWKQDLKNYLYYKKRSGKGFQGDHRKSYPEKIAPIEYAYQEMDDLPEGFSVPEGRKKPWGTGQAILAARNLIRSRSLSSMQMTIMEKKVLRSSMTIW